MGNVLLTEWPSTSLDFHTSNKISKTTAELKTAHESALDTRICLRLSESVSVHSAALAAVTDSMLSCGDQRLWSRNI